MNNNKLELARTLAEQKANKLNVREDVKLSFIILATNKIARTWSMDEIETHLRLGI